MPSSVSISRRTFAGRAAAAGLIFSGFTQAAQPRILVHGHRGARARRPENTIPAFQYAIAQGIDVLELDVAVTRDNIPVVSHDPLMNAAICTGPVPGRAIHTMNLAELREYDCGAKQNPGFQTQVPVPGTRVPRLDEVFALGHGNSVQFNVETKIFADRPELTPDAAAFARLILDLVRKHKLESRVILQSFDPRTTREMKKMAPEIRRSALFEKQRDWIGVAQEFDATILSPEYHLVEPRLVAEAHANHLQVVPWTANNAADWQKLVDAGVDAVISDDPAALLAWLKSKNLR